MNYYICDVCKFQFERFGKVDNCPDCGKDAIRLATEEEIAEYMRVKAEVQEEYNKDISGAIE